MTLNINLTRRIRRRKLKDGSVVEQTRYVLNWRDPRTGARQQRFFERQREAQERRRELLAAYERGVYSSQTKTVTVEAAVAAWLETKRGVVRPITLRPTSFSPAMSSGHSRQERRAERSSHPAEGPRPK